MHDFHFSGADIADGKGLAIVGEFGAVPLEDRLISRGFFQDLVLGNGQDGGEADDGV